MAMEIINSLPFPTVERPFGIELWPIFDKAFSSVVGYSPQDFRFIRDKTAMSNFRETAAMLLSYYIVVFGGRELMRNRPALRLNKLFVVHNLILTTFSAILLALFMEELLPTLYNNGLFFTICDRRGGWTDKLVILYYLVYLVKYWELTDTVFLVLKKKPLTFLHTYHHGATALLCWTQLIGSTAVSWVPITLNLMVHVVMYWYYFQSARGIRVWWKQWITRFQILQFVIDLIFVYFASYTYFSSTYFPWLPNGGSCAGEEFAAFAGIAILSSYLLLFVSFYVATYKKASRGGRPRRNTAKQAAIDLKNAEIPTAGKVLKDIPAINGFVKSDNKEGYANGFAASDELGGPVTRSRKN